VDFGAIPPEINSARMYSGPGSAPMRAASTAWNMLAAELESAASSYQSTINVLADDEWRGPASASMAAAVAPYVTWMSTTGAQADHTAAQQGDGEGLPRRVHGGVHPASRRSRSSMLSRRTRTLAAPSVTATTAGLGTWL